MAALLREPHLVGHRPGDLYPIFKVTMRTALPDEQMRNDAQFKVLKRIFPFASDDLIREFAPQIRMYTEMVRGEEYVHPKGGTFMRVEPMFGADGEDSVRQGIGVKRDGMITQIRESHSLTLELQKDLLRTET